MGPRGPKIIPNPPGQKKNSLGPQNKGVTLGVSSSPNFPWAMVQLDLKPNLQSLGGLTEYSLNQGLPFGGGVVKPFYRPFLTGTWGTLVDPSPSQGNSPQEEALGGWKARNQEPGWQRKKVGTTWGYPTGRRNRT